YLLPCLHFIIALLSISSLYFCFFFSHAPATTKIYTLSLHDALPISLRSRNLLREEGHEPRLGEALRRERRQQVGPGDHRDDRLRSEEHTSELQSHLNLVCRLLLEKKKETK